MEIAQSKNSIKIKLENGMELSIREMPDGVEVSNLTRMNNQLVVYPSTYNCVLLKTK